MHARRILISSSALASLLNFLVYVLGPSLHTTQFDEFLPILLAANFFMAGFGASVAPMAVYIESRGGNGPLRIKYSAMILSTWLISFLLIFVVSGEFLPFGAVLVLCASGYLQALLIVRNYYYRAAFIQIVQPSVFCIVVFMLPDYPLDLGFFLASLISGFSALFLVIGAQGQTLTSEPDSRHLVPLVIRVAAGSIVPLLLQFEALMSHLLYENLSMFVSLQKFYSSIPTSILGLFGTLLAVEAVTGEEKRQSEVWFYVTTCTLLGGSLIFVLKFFGLIRVDVMFLILTTAILAPYSGIVYFSQKIITSNPTILLHGALKLMPMYLIALFILSYYSLGAQYMFLFLLSMYILLFFILFRGRNL